MNFHSFSADMTLKKLNSTKNGLTAPQVAERQKQHGYNELTNAKKVSLLSRFFAQFQDFMILVLLAAAGISFLLSLIEGNADFADPVIILIVVTLNALLGVIQETKAEHSLEALKKLSAPNASLLRNGKRITLPARELVPGDIIFIETGNLIPADARLLSSNGLKVDESALTGESLSVEKQADCVFSYDTPLGDRINMLYSSSIATAGHGIAVVTATGMQTEVGKIAGMILEEDSTETPLQKRLAETGKVLAITALGICLVLFFLGVMQGIPLFTMFMTSVSLAVASIPESLPAVVTIMLSLGVQRMVKKNAIVRKLPAVETLGSATYICSDKTGTLTQNRMKVTKTFSFPCTAKLPSMELMGLLCNNATEEFGEGTELALYEHAKEKGYRLSDRERYPRIYEIPFDSARKCMTSVHKLPNQEEYLVITKGAFDVLLPKSHPSSSDRITLGFQHDTMAKDALRVLAIGYRIIPANRSLLTPDMENDLTLLGLFGLMDPPRSEAKEAVSVCKKAGITPVMITGDHKNTACAIAAKLGILTPDTYALTGAEIDAMPEDEFIKNIKRYTVFARVSPEHKVRIVKALQSHGEIVAMTGDGVNDAPALKAADIGCAMGKSGTDVAKNAADMILMDDNFATIVSAVREGRGIYDNIKKSIHFLLSCNIGEIITIFFAILFHMPSPLAAVQLLWVNLITDSLPALALGTENPEDDIMSRPPVSPKSGLFHKELLTAILTEGMLIGALSLFSYVLGTHYIGNGSTMAFAVLSFSQLFHAFNIRSHHSLFKIGVFSNKKMVGAFAVCVTLQLLVLLIPWLRSLFLVEALTGIQWVTVIGCSVAPVVFAELQKYIANSEHES